jgi:GT2 family glycosyltransferase
MTTFTVAIPTHDRRETVVLAVLSALRQTRPPAQVLVTCDGCTDGTADALRAIGDPRVTAIELEKRRGYAYGHRNVALEQATGDLILWLADDDLLLPDHLERLAERQAIDDLDMVTSPAIVVHPDDELEWIGRDWSVPYVRDRLQHENTNVMASVAARTSLIRQVGGWDDAIERAADWDLWKRAIATGARAAMTDEPTVLHFRATGRTQPWADRVAQNTAWLERIGSSDELPALRRAFRRTRGIAEAALHADRMALVSGLEEQVAARDDERFHLHRAIDAERVQGETIAEASRHEQATLRAQLDQVAARAADAEHRLAETQARAARDRATLEAIYAGGWWRLRGTVRRLTAPGRSIRQRMRRR